MVSNHQYTRMNTIEIRDSICRKIGNQRAEKYFDHLRRLFTSQLSKIQFDKLCVRTIGRENLPLHNRLIKSLIKNACVAKVAPPKAQKVEQILLNDYERSSGSLQSPYSEVFPRSPRKNRSQVNRDRRHQDRRSPLSPLGKSPDTTGEEVVQRVHEQQSATELRSSRPPVEGPSVEDGEEVEQFARSPSIQSRSPVTAPLGISINKGGGARKAIINSGFGSARTIHQETCQNSHVLPDTISLRYRLEKMLQLEGVGISVDCANMLNTGLDAFLRRLIEPGMAVAGARSGIEPGSNEILHRGIAQKRLRTVGCSMLDFRVAMESNPRLLGEDWSIQLEKICTRAMEE